MKDVPKHNCSLPCRHNQGSISSIFIFHKHQVRTTPEYFLNARTRIDGDDDELVTIGDINLEKKSDLHTHPDVAQE
ncbi:hypothetical protein OUZ56_027658 [Daphnia magna]|uniref:Uncharacterized protein n=1 Tax=Daphnia magna TaxID=35525 RepID=A0ABR0B1J3_9CRUS|nr:hypothetical protein OUZ56_027658 [Daphnia magna]